MYREMFKVLWQDEANRKFWEMSQKVILDWMKRKNFLGVEFSDVEKEQIEAMSEKLAHDPLGSLLAHEAKLQDIGSDLKEEETEADVKIYFILLENLNIQIEKLSAQVCHVINSRDTYQNKSLEDLYKDDKKVLSLVRAQYRRKEDGLKYLKEEAGVAEKTFQNIFEAVPHKQKKEIEFKVEQMYLFNEKLKTLVLNSIEIAFA